MIAKIYMMRTAGVFELAVLCESGEELGDPSSASIVRWRSECKNASIW